MKTFKNFFQKSISKEPTKEKGYSGTAFTYGDIYEDYNPNWQGAAKKELIPKMVNDDQVSIGLEAYKQPIKGTRFYFEPYKDDEDKTTDKDEANAKWMEDNLFNNKKGIANSVSWRQIVTEALTSLEWGHAVFETVYARSPEGWYLKKLGFRDQRTIDRWVKTDGSEGITQQFDYGIEMGPNKGETQLEIDMDKLFILSFDKTGDNYEGKSLLRKVYRPWQTKDRYLRYENRLQEKFCGGVIQAWLPRNATDDDKSAYETVIEDFLATKRNGVLHPGPKEDGWEVEFMDMKLPETNILESIKYQDAKISETLLVSFLSTAHNNQAGSYAKTTKLADFFMLAVNGWLQLFADEFNAQVLPQYSYLNGWENAPCLTFEPMKIEDANEIMALMIERLTRAGALTNNLETENIIRHKLGLPEVDESEYEEVQKKKEEAAKRKAEIKKAEANQDTKPKTEEEAKEKDIDDDKKKVKAHRTLAYALNEVDIGDDIDVAIEEAKQYVHSHYTMDMDFTDSFEMPDIRFSLHEEFKKSEFPRELTIFEKKSNIAGMAKYSKDAEQVMAENYDALSADMQNFLLTKAGEAVEKNDLTILQGAKLPKVSELKSVTNEVSKQSFEVGKSVASEEIGEEVPRNPRDVNGTIRATSNQMVNDYSTLLLATAVAATMQVIGRKGGIKETSKSDVIKNVDEAMNTKVLQAKNTFLTSTVPGSMNAGRSFVGSTYAEKIDYVQYSAILDMRTTNRCMSLDGRIVKYGAGDYFNYSPPGHYNCRSIWVFITKDSPDNKTAKSHAKKIPSTIPETGPLGNYQEMKDPKILRDSLASDLLSEGS